MNLRILGVSMALIGIVSAGLASSRTSKTREDWKPGVHMMEAVEHVLHCYDAHGKDSDFGLDQGANPKSSVVSNVIFGAFISKGKSQSWSRDFQANQEYLIVGGGDSDVKDVDIVIIDANGKEIAKDEEEDAEPYVKFRVPTKGRYTIKLTLEDSSGTADFCTMAVLQKGGWDVDFHELKDAVKNVLDDCAKQNENNSPEGINFYDKSFCFFGTVLGKGQSHGGNFTKKGDHPCMLFVGGSNSVAEVTATITGDMWIIPSGNQGENQHPKVNYSLGEGDKLGWNVKNTTDKDENHIVITVICQDLHS